VVEEEVEGEIVVLISGNGLSGADKGLAFVEEGVGFGWSTLATVWVDVSVVVDGAVYTVVVLIPSET
jgi:hypothetical protein